MNFTPHENNVIVPLLSIEFSKALLEESGITSITFYSGDLEQATAYIRARFKKIVAANPWLAGRVVKNRQHKNLQLVHPKSPVLDTMIDQLFHSSPSQVKIGSEMGYPELCKAVKSAMIPKGRQLVNKQGLVTRVSIVPDADHSEDGFALIFSLSHCPADGHTYYQILNQFFSSGNIQPLQARRIHEASKKTTDAVGKKLYDYPLSAPVIFNILKSMVFGKKAECFAYFVDPEKVNKVKAEYTTNPEEDVTFVSTNDILTSSFAKSIRARICMMAINFRNRIEGLVDQDAGNYEGFLLYDEKMYGTPGKVRKVLQKGPPFLSMAKELPGFWESLSCNLGQVTNWSSFAGDLSFEGCKQRLHLPVYDTF
jgi:hypothetical protein